jgi:hypothetical protein
MQPALHIKTRVLPGNKVEVELPPGSEGKEVNVFVVLAEPATGKSLDILEFLASARKHQASKTAEEIDQQLRAERNAWDS